MFKRSYVYGKIMVCLLNGKITIKILKNFNGYMIFSLGEFSCGAYAKTSKVL